MKKLNVYATLSSIFALPKFDEKNPACQIIEMDFMLYPHTEKMKELYSDQYVSELVGYLMMHEQSKLTWIDGYSYGAYIKAANLMDNMAKTLMYDKGYKLNIRHFPLSKKNDIHNAMLDHKTGIVGDTETIVLANPGDWAALYLSKFPDLKQQANPQVPAGPNPNLN